MKINRVATAATISAMTGDNKDGRITLPMTPSSLVPSPAHLTPAKPAPPMVPPTRPSRRACDEDEGSPSSQVNRFQMMPPTRPPKTMSMRRVPLLAVYSLRGRPLESCSLTTELDTVSATSTESSAPTQLRIAANVTAPLGLKAPVAIDAAIAFPVSWKPLVKSNARATTTTKVRMMVAVVTGSC